MTAQPIPTASSARRPRGIRLLAAVAALALGILGLVPAATASAAPLAEISGTVTGVDSGLPIANLRVQVYNATSNINTYTDASGNYTLTGIPDGSYRLRFNAGGEFTTGSLISEFWNDEPLSSQATLVPLVAGDSLTFDAALATGGMIKGTVIGNDGQGSMAVNAYLQDPLNPTVFNQLSTTMAAPDGSYTLRGLAAGNYEVTFGDNNQGDGGTKYGLEAWDNQKYGSGDLVTVTGTATTPNINAVLTIPGPVTVTRLAGTDRFSTSAAVWSDPTTFPDGMGGLLYIANGRNFADALGAGPAAAQDDAPLMLVEQNSIPEVVRVQIQRIAPEKIVMVGGPAALSESVRAQLELLAPTVTRISGVDRYDTSRQLIEFAFELSLPANTLIVATGANFPDALSAGPAAGTRFNSPVLLVPGTGTLGAADFAIIDDIDPGRIVIVGGTSVVSSAVESQLVGTGRTVERIAGADRYATSVAIVDAFFPGPAKVYLAVGTGFADALSGAARAAAEGNALYVTPPTCIPLSHLLEMRNYGLDEVFLLGGPAALSARVEGLHRC